MKDFAKIFTTPHGQLLATCDHEDGAPVVTFRGADLPFVTPSVLYTFDNEAARDAAFDGITQALADETAAELWNTANNLFGPETAEALQGDL